MTTFEERLAATNLTPFKQNNVKDDVFKLLLKQIYKYQNFKQSIILEKINCMSYSKSTVKGYIQSSILYLNHGVKNHILPRKGYYILEDFKAKHEAILTPSETDKARPYKPYKKSTLSPTPPEPIEPPKYIETIPDQYGVKIQNTIKLFANKEACDAYIECYKEFNGDKPVELVKVEFEAV